MEVRIMRENRFHIICPYCFEQFNDDEVHFRSARVFTKEEVLETLPEDYEGIDDFSNRYNKSDKEEIRQRYEEREFFKETEDKKYNNFWKRFGGTTEQTLAKKANKIKNDYNRRVIDPKSTEAQKYLVEQKNGTYFIMDDKEKMVTGIQLNTPGREICKARVCPYCHNPLPQNYGKYKTRFISIIGITNAGKTVFLSKFLQAFTRDIAKIGMVAPGYTESVTCFCHNNRIEDDNSILPQATPPTSFQQPLIFEVMEDVHKPHTHIVLYDVAGELFSDEREYLDYFAPFVSHSDGIILLLDPLQFQSIRENRDPKKYFADTKEALETLYRTILGNQNKEAPPLAVCISKIDEIYDELGPEIEDMICRDYEGIPDENMEGLYLKEFNGNDFQDLEEKLKEFVRDNDPALYNYLCRTFENHAFFALTALGCGVESKEIDGKERYSPKRKVEPKRIMDPIFWLFYKLGLIGCNKKIDTERRVTCPYCSNMNVKRLEVPHEVITKRLFRPQIVDRFSYFCESCENYFNNDQ